MDFLNSLAAFLVAIALLITFHELGHFWIARRCGVKVLRFSVGFGRPLWRRNGADGTEYVIAAIPVGGYVRMLDEREGPVPPAERGRAFNNKPLLHRSLVVAAGPAFNFLFAIAAWWIVFMVGVSGPRPIVGGVTEGSPAASAGIGAGDEIIGVSGRPTPTWSALLEQMVSHVIAGRPMDLAIRRANGGEESVQVRLPGIEVDDLAGGRLLHAVGVTPFRPVVPAVIGDVQKGGAAQRDGLVPGDRVLSADGVAIRDWEQWVTTVRAHPGIPLRVVLERDGVRIELQVTPESVAGTGGARAGRIGAAVDARALEATQVTARERYPPPTALLRSVDKTVEMSVVTLRVLWKMVLGQASMKNLSGPISIAQYAGESAGIGAISFLTFLAIVSVSLGVLNLLPIPLLDGGHLMYYLIEFVTGKPVSDSVQSIGQQLGMVLLLGLMGLALYNDLMRLIG
jgi:regulator of sigma E protease